MKTQVIANIDTIGFHFFKNAPDKVSFLRFNHRHIFNIKAGFLVENLDRDIEIFTVEELIQDYINETYGVPAQFDGMSCEMIATDLIEFLSEEKCIWVEVLEDNKGGARVEL